jgi:hypothetical protein
MEILRELEASLLTNAVRKDAAGVQELGTRLGMRVKA